MPSVQKIAPCLWFDDQAEEAVNFYIGIFKNSKITNVARYGEAGREVHGGKPSSVMIIAFELDGHAFSALNGGPVFKFPELFKDHTSAGSQRAMNAMLRMKKLNIAELQRAYAG